MVAPRQANPRRLSAWGAEGLREVTRFAVDEVRDRDETIAGLLRLTVALCSLVSQRARENEQREAWLRGELTTWRRRALTAEGALERVCERGSVAAALEAA